MAIKHAAVKSPGERGTSDEWNAPHTTEDEDRPRRAATFIIAASDSRETSKADYVCDGTDDQDEINTAINALPAYGGEILLLEGTYYLKDSVVITADGVTLRGAGSGVTLVADAGITPATPLIYSDTHGQIILQDFLICGDNKGVPGIDVEDCYYVHISRLVVYQCTVGMYLHGPSCTWNWVRDSVMYSNSSHGLHSSEADNLRVQGCFFLVNGGNGIYNTAGSSVNISSCDFYWNALNGIFIESTMFNSVTSNVVYANDEHGIKIDTGSDHIISSNYVAQNDYNNTASFDGIYVDADDCVVHGNRCGNNDRYEINVAGGSRNMVHDNNVHGVDHVGTINDAGAASSVADNVT